MTNPFFGFLNTCRLFFDGSVSFNKTSVNRQLVMDDDQSFTIFRYVRITSVSNLDPQAYFIVRFKLKNMSVKKNISFSRIPMLFFMGFTGFRSKYWACNFDTGVCQGLYEWQTLRNAEDYSKSIAMKFMQKRSEPGSVSFRIVDKLNENLNFKIV